MTDDSTNPTPAKSVWQLLSETFELYIANVGLLLILGLAAAVVSWTVSLPDVFTDNVAITGLAGLAGFVVSMTAGVLFQGALTFAAAEVRAGRTIEALPALQASLARFHDLFWASVRSLAICIGFAITIIGIPWAINRFVKWWFIIPAVVLDGRDGETALEHSGQLVSSRGWWSVALVLVVSHLVTSVPGLIISWMSEPLVGAFGRSQVQAAVATVVVPITAVFTTLFYLDLKGTQTQQPTPERDSVRY